MIQIIFLSAHFAVISCAMRIIFFFFFSSRRRHTRYWRDWSSDVCSSDLFAGWREGEDSTPFRVSLTENYRSTPNILRVASQVIGMNTASADFPKKVLTTNRPEGEKIRVVELVEIEDEARWVAGEIERIHRAGRRWRDFAVLYRAHTHRDAWARELPMRKIPFVIC